jgi:hypothetical protein
MFSFFRRKKKDASESASKHKKPVAPKDLKPARAASPTTAKAASLKDTKPKAQPPTSLKAALAAMEEAIPGSVEEEKPAPKISAGADLDKAKKALAKKASRPMDRQALIEQALAIQKAQSKMLDNLPQETRDRLRSLALKAFVLEKPDDKKKLN